MADASPSCNILQKEMVFLSSLHIYIIALGVLSGGLGFGGVETTGVGLALCDYSCVLYTKSLPRRRQEEDGLYPSPSFPSYLRFCVFSVFLLIS